ncbi:DUF5719 family protein [Georgenia sp. MJ170]|uniref:DUF5719 family protein n=1 Tax=Georgenia sunbinii TaxID=3117728 RepID=UPI002F25F204
MTDNPTRRRRRLLRTTVTAASGVALLAAAGGVLVGGGELPTDATPVAATTVDVPATTSVQVCAGPPRLATAAAGEDLAYDEFDPEGSGTTTLLGALSLAVADSSPGAAQLADLAGTTPVDLPFEGEARVATVESAGEAMVLRAEPMGDRSALATGTSLATTAAGDLRGLTATACQPPAAGAWLVGGSTEPGSSAQLVLSNPGDTPATVTMTGWGSTGPLDMSAAGSVLVPPNGQQVVLLEAVVAGEERLALQLDVTGGEVAATLQDSRLRGLVPAGTDLIHPGAPPADELVIPGIVLGETAADDVDPSVLRIVNPGEEEVGASVELLGADGVTPVPGAEDLVLDPGVVIDVSLAGLPAGGWSARVTADAPVAAAAMLTSTGEPTEADPDTPPVDRAWVPATAALETGLVALPGLADDLVTARLVMANPAGEPVSATVTPVLGDGTTGEPTRLDVPAGGSADTDLTTLAAEPVAAVQVQTDDAATLHAAVHLTAAAPDGALLAVVPVPQDTQSARSVAIAPAPRTLG